MNKSIIILITFFFSSIIFGQNFQGNWYGKLDVGMGKIPLILHIQQIKKNKYEATLDSPSQKAFDISVSSITIKKNNIYATIENIAAEFKGTLENDIIKGKFSQMGRELTLDLSRDSNAIAPPNRPQEPKKPYPYNEKEVTFVNPKGNIKLAGTLTYPKEGENFKAVVLITGSGPQDRNEEMLEHKPFLIISDYLTRHGIAVLRYDDRGFGESKGSFSSSDIYDFRDDAVAAITFLKSQTNIDKSHIGVIGHSEGGMIAEMLAANKDIDFAVLLAAPAVNIKDLMIQQNIDVMKSQNETQSGMDSTTHLVSLLYNEIINNDNCNSSCLMEIIKKEVEPKTYQKNIMQFMSMAQQIDAKWFREFIKFQPKQYLEKIQIPILALNGDKDIQVAGDMNLSAIREAMKIAGNSQFTEKLYPNMNHLFQICKTCSVAEYGEIETTFSEEVLIDITNWINQLK